MIYFYSQEKKNVKFSRSCNFLLFSFVFFNQQNITVSRVKSDGVCHITPLPQDLPRPNILSRGFKTVKLGQKINAVKGLVKKYRGGGGGWAGAFGNVVDKKHMTPPPPFGTKTTDPPLKQGWKLHDPPPS